MKTGTMMQTTSPDWAESIQAVQNLPPDEAPEDVATALEENDDPTIPEAPVPTVDDTDRAIASRTLVYPDWIPSQTFVVSGPLPHGSGPGTPMPDVLTASIHVLRIHKKILERVKGAEKGGRWAFRVMKPCPTISQ